MFRLARSGSVSWNSLARRAVVNSYAKTIVRLSASALSSNDDDKTPELPTPRDDWRTVGQAKLNFAVAVTCATGSLLTWKYLPVDLSHLFPAVSTVFTAAGTYMVAMSASMQNQLAEQEFDKLMKRTSHRPLPTGRLTAAEVQTMSRKLALGGTVMMTASACVLHPFLMSGASLAWVFAPAGLALLNWVLYVKLYTAAKRSTKWNTELGAIVGAIPPLIGASAVAPILHPVEAILFGAYMYFWQLQHFYIICTRFKDDYSAAGYKMRSHFEQSEGSTLRYGFVTGMLPLALLGGLLYYFDALDLWPVYTYAGLTAVLMVPYGIAAFRGVSKKSLLLLQIVGYFYLLLIAGTFACNGWNRCFSKRSQSASASNSVTSPAAADAAAAAATATAASSPSQTSTIVPLPASTSSTSSNSNSK